jgi:predicted RNA-binding Zn-ribbon protein involved in translation (DUF1610 family)
MPKDFKAWLGDKIHHWANIEPAPILVNALEHQDRECVMAAYRCCERLFKKGDQALQHGKYLRAAKYYVMAGFDRTYFEDIKRWDLPSFEERLAREVYHRNYSEVGYPEAMKIMEMLPPKAPCEDCGFKLTKPETAQVKCPNCGKVQTYAKCKRDRAMATLCQAKFPDEYRRFRRTFIDPRAAMAFIGSAEVQELMDLVEDYL